MVWHYRNTVLFETFKKRLCEVDPTHSALSYRFQRQVGNF